MCKIRICLHGSVNYGPSSCYWVLNLIQPQKPRLLRSGAFHSGRLALQEPALTKCCRRLNRWCNREVARDFRRELPQRISC